MELRNVLYIAVMGATGSGKTTFVNLASGSNLQVGHALISCTSEAEPSKTFILDGKPVILIDTPGFDDTTKSESEILRLIVEFLVALHVDGKKLSGIIFLHRITDVRMGGVAVKNIRLFRRLCGDDPLQNVVIATNRWSDMNPEIGEQREQELTSSDEFFKLAIDQGARIVRHTDTQESADAIIRKVLHLPPVVLRVQKEVVDENKEIFQTDAGKELDNQLEEHSQKLQKDLDVLQKEMRELMDEYTKMKEDKEKAGIVAERLKKEMSDLKKRHEEELNDIKKDTAEATLALKLVAQKRDTLRHITPNLYPTQEIITKALRLKLKFIVVGDYGVGKSSLVRQFCGSKRNSNISNQSSIDIETRTIDINGRHIRLLIWDTAGQEKHGTLTTTYYRGANGVLLVYDVTNRSSFNRIQDWYTKIQENAPECITKILVGNHSHVNSNRKVTVTGEEGSMQAAALNMQSMHVSVMEKESIERVFMALARDVLTYPTSSGEEYASATNVEPKIDLKEPKRSRCCGF